MSLFTSTDFASACATGTDWRDTSKNVLEKLDNIRTQGDDFNFGFLYISDQLADDANSIFNLFKSVLKIENWVGSVGIGVIGCNESHIDTPAITAMIGRFPEDSFCVFPAANENDETPDSPVSQEPVKNWLASNTPMLSIVHCDPFAPEDPRQTLSELERTTNAFLVGGVSSARGPAYQIANQVCNNAVSGTFFAHTLPVSTTLSQGCAPIGTIHTVTKADDYTILEIDDRRALDVLQDVLRKTAAQKLGKTQTDFTTDLQTIETSDHIPGEFQNLFKGEVHIALPLTLSDQKDYMVRNITGIDADEGSITISEAVGTGDSIQFMERNDETLSADLSRAVVDLCKRVQHERGAFDPKGALYISCLARSPKKGPGSTDKNVDEIGLINDIIGNVPMAGFYAGGEINNARLYGYTGILTLFF